MMFIGTIFLLASLLSLNSSTSATSINRDAASIVSSNDENDAINSLLIEYNQIVATRNYDSDNLLLNSNDSNEVDEGCDESFPLAPTTLSSSSSSLSGDNERRQLKVAIPPPSQSNNIPTRTSEWYETGEYYAPTCHDVKTNKRRIDIRYLQQCFGGACWDPQIGVSHSNIFCILLCRMVDIPSYAI